MLTLNNLTWSSSAQSLHFSFSLATGERVAILGPSGAGKSSLLNLIAGFLPASQGQLQLNGQDHTHTSPAQRPVSILFQENNLFPHLSVEQNIALGLDPGLRLNATQHQHVKNIAHRTGLNDKLSHLPEMLSGGQRQRAALARCLIRQQPILLLDEPFSALDPALRRDMLSLVDEVCHERQLTLLMVSHNIADARQIADRSILIDSGEVSWDGPISDLLGGHVPAAGLLGIPLATSAKYE